MYAKQVFYQAVDALATSPDSIQKRLEYAGIHLVKLQRNGDDLPPEHRDEFRSIWEQLGSKSAAGDEGTIAATTKQLSDEECSKIAERILGIYTDIMGGLA